VLIYLRLDIHLTYLPLLLADRSAPQLQIQLNQHSVSTSLAWLPMGIRVEVACMFPAHYAPSNYHVVSNFRVLL